MADTYMFKDETIVPLFVEHSPESILERNRIIREYGKDSVSFTYDTINHLIRPNIFRTIGSSETISPVNPDLLFNQGHLLYFKNIKHDFATLIRSPNGMDALAMTRSLGDYYISAFGCSPVPTIIQSKLDTGTTFFVGSDGIWDNWLVKDFRDFLFSNNFHKTFEKSAKEAIKNFGRSSDDMTLLQFVVSSEFHSCANSK